ncbi:hypothetical protein MMYC01_209977 [Madurella mycetomatis]|uniref:Uncharacterized protein n=1 Tax=Madurella mycetomatis TaxID=100816 RepID=A0A175VQZ0_9PEZI|nr:hypothetical protein MMYC01_209977 [Madurella mycetomatis]
MNFCGHETVFGERVNHVPRLTGSSFSPSTTTIQSLLSPPDGNHNIPDIDKLRYTGMERVPLLDTPGATHCEPVMVRYSSRDWLLERMMHACVQGHLVEWSPEELRLKWIVETWRLQGGRAIYFLCYIGRSNIDNARILNSTMHNDMQTEIGATTYQFNRWPPDAVARLLTMLPTSVYLTRLSIYSRRQGSKSTSICSSNWDFMSTALLALGIGSFLFRTTLRQTLEFVDAFGMLGLT